MRSSKLRKAIRVAEAIGVTIALLGTVAFFSYRAGESKGRASVRFSNTSFAGPAGALFVSPSGSDANVGSQAAPLATLGRAVAKATAGATVVMRGGTYRESVNSITRKITIQAYPNERPWLDGRRVVSGFATSGSAWVRTGWTTGLCATCYDPRAILASAPMAGSPEMVFFDGAPLRQVGSRAAVVAGTFYVDLTAHALYLGSNPAGHLVEATVLAKALQFNTAGAAGSALIGIGVIGYGSQYKASANAAMVVVTSPNVTLQDDTFAWSASDGAAIFAAGGVVRGSTFLHNGYQGLAGNRANGLLIESSRFAYSNQEHFVYGASPVAGAAGVKIANTVGVTVRDSVFDNNAATGLWFDLSCQNATVVRNVVEKNLWDGIALELVDTALAASNVVTDNGAVGIKISGTTRTRIWNNTLVNNATAQLGVYEDPRSNSNSAQRAAGITWDTASIAVQNNIIVSDDGQATLPLVHTYDGNSPKRVGASQMITGMNGDIYGRASTAAAPDLSYWATMTAPNHATRSQTLPQVRAGTGFEATGIENVNYVSSPLFADERSGDFHLIAGSPASASGHGLPSDIAAAVGVPGGVAVDRGALLWPSTTAVPPPTTVPTTTTTGSTTAPTTTVAPPTTTTTPTTTTPTTTATTVSVPPPTTTPTTVSPRVGPAVYGMWNKTTGDRCYSTSTMEVAAGATHGYTSFGVAFHGLTATGRGYLPVYRLHSKRGEHLFTASTAERDLLLGAGWKLEAIPFVLSVYERPGLVPVYRFYDLVKHAHYLSLRRDVLPGSKADGLLLWAAP